MKRICRYWPLLGLVYVTMLMVPNNAQAEKAVLETYESLQSTPAGAVELITGKFQSIMLKTPIGFRAFSPQSPTWDKKVGAKRSRPGMRLVVYLMNLKGVPRPSDASDRLIIEDLIKDNFLVVVVDYANAEVKDPLEMTKDIHALFVKFGGRANFSKNRIKTLELSLFNTKVIESFSYNNNLDIKTDIPIDQSAIYVIPSGFTVEPYLVFKDNVRVEQMDGYVRTDMFMDIVYPKKLNNNTPVPILLEGSSTGSGDYIINGNHPFLFTWLFNGYAFATFSFSFDQNYNFQLDAMRFLSANKDRFSLSGKVGTAGCSKSGDRCFVESNMEPGKDDTFERVKVCMPAVCGYSIAVREDLDKNATPIVLTYGHLNSNGADNGDRHYDIVRDYEKAGVPEKCLFYSEPRCGHEYNVYRLNEIMTFYDKYCK